MKTFKQFLKDEKVNNKDYLDFKGSSNKRELKKEMKREIARFKKKDHKDPSAYPDDWTADKKYRDEMKAKGKKMKTSSYTDKFKQMYGESQEEDLERYRQRAVQVIKEREEWIKRLAEEALGQEVNRVSPIGSVTDGERFTEDSDIDVAIYTSPTADLLDERKSQIVQQIFAKHPLSDLGVINTLVFVDSILEDVSVALKNKSEKTGIPMRFLRRVFNKGMAAWRTGHRPGVSQHQWAMARVNSFIVGGPARKSDQEIWDAYQKSKK